MRERQKRIAPRSRGQQEAIDHNHLLLHKNYNNQQKMYNKQREESKEVVAPFEWGGGPVKSRNNNSINTRTPTQCRLLFAAVCCLLVISSDFPLGATAANRPINQTRSNATSIKDKNVIKLTATSQVAAAAAFNGATSQLANDKQREPLTRAAVESNGHNKRATTTTTTAINREQQFGAQKSLLQPKTEQRQQPKRSDRLEAAPRTMQPLPPPQLFKYHLNHSRPPPLVPITIQQQQQQHLAARKGNSLVAVTPMTTRAGGDAPSGLNGVETKTINRTRTAANNRAGSGDLLMAASEPDGRSLVAANTVQQQQQQQLVQLQLPLELHLKLKPLPLPMPPPPSVRQQQQPQTDSKFRRSLDDGDKFGANGRAQVPTTTTTTTEISTTQSSPQVTTPTTPTATATTKQSGHMMSNRHSSPGDLQALTWQEAKRVLLMNSIAPPLVQAAHRRIERRHLLMAGHMPPPPPASQITFSEQPLASNHLLAADVGVQQVADNSLHGAGPSLKFQEFFPPSSSSMTTTATTSPVYATTLATAPDLATTTKFAGDNPQAEQNSGALIGLSRSGLAANSQQQDREQPTKQGHHHQQARLSSMHRIELNAVEFLNASTHQRTTRPNVAPVTLSSAASAPTSEHEWRIQQMAAAMLPFVWPSFQLTTGHAHLGAAKLRARSTGGDSSRQRQQQQVAARTTTSSPPVMAPTWPMKYQQLDRTIAGSGPVAASEFRPTFVDQDQVGDQQVVVGMTTTTTSTTARPTTTTTGRPTTTTSRRELTRPQQQDTRSARKRRRKSGYLQQQQERLERQNYQLQLNKKAKQVATSKPELVKEIGAQRGQVTATPPASTEGPVTTTNPPLSSDSTRLASRYQMPRIKFNSNRTTATTATTSGVRRSEQATDERRALAVEGQENSAGKQVTQLPKTLSKLIEQQLAAAAGSSNSTLRQNLLLLQQYFSQQQNQTTLPSKAPTTSVSRVVRIHGAPASGDLLRVPPVGNQSEPVGNLNTVATSTTTTTTTTTTTVAPTPVAGAVKLIELETEASAERDRKTLEPPTTTTTTTTTTERPSSTQRSQVDAAVASLEIGSNKISPDASEDDAAPSPPASAAQRVVAATTTTTTTVRPAQINNRQQQVADSARPRQQPPVQEQQHQSPWQKSNRASAAHSARNNKNIKLFHFKRKPDVAKLPFYKKPLNYTELGWTPEEIEREQRRLAELQQLELSGDKSAESSESESDEDEEADRQSQAATTRAPKAASGPLTIGQSGDLSLLKRKRRAKNQFERLMAELQAAAALAANGTSTSTSTTTELPPPAAPAAGGRASGQPTNNRDQDDDDDDDDDEDGGSSSSGKEGQEVPAVRKKIEPLVMKPMFFDMSQQKRRRANQASGNQTSESTISANETTTTVVPPPPPPTIGDSLETSRSKPIVRLRRKHHGEQPEVVGSRASHLELEPQIVGQSPWRPSGLAAWSAPSSPAVGKPQRLLLVPSGLLTPSGSHPMPLFAPTGPVTHQTAALPMMGSPPTATWHEQQASAPASQPTVSSATQAETTGQVGHSSAPQVASLIQQQQQALGANSELRVPKLLVKPMRPAKYSLNGYIPKPSLVNQMQHHHHPAPLAQPAHTPAINFMQAAGGLQAARPAKQSPAPRSNAQQKQQQQQDKQERRQLALASGRQPATQQNKDLDSSTSNEIFSRRRGLQRGKPSAAQPRSSPSSSGISFEALLARSSQPEATAATLGDPSQADGELPIPLSPPRNQMEENRRKYVRQHQQTLKSIAPMSAQRANQIKAKLGLVASPNSIRPRRPTPAAETTSGDMIEFGSGDSSLAEAQSKLSASSGRRKWSTPAESSASTSSISTLEPPDAALELAIAGGGQQLTAGSGAYHTIPKTDFECTNKRGHFVSGLFADFKTGCRVWHLCSNNRKYSFLCPIGTIFNAKVRICDWRYNVKCENEPPQ